MTLTRSVYHFDRLKPFDTWTIGLYVALSLGLTYYFSTELNVNHKAGAIFMYALGTHLVLYMFCYKSLRNLTVFFIWLLIGLLHLLIYFKLKGDTTLEMFRGHATVPLRNTVPLLIFYQVLRLVSLKIRGHELVVPNKISRTDMFNERQPTGVDFLLLLAFWTISIFLAMPFNGWLK
jgi:hypothetical protein